MSEGGEYIISVILMFIFLIIIGLILNAIFGGGGEQSWSISG